MQNVTQLYLGSRLLRQSGRLECGRIINDATSVGIISREEFVPILYAREGNVQDNDDVMNVYAAESDQLREYYGDFFFTELVEASDNRNKVLVADVNDTAVGCLAVTADIAFDTFVLSAFKI